MPIVSSKIIADRAQADGRRNITEEHTFSDGEVFRVNYKALPGDDAATLMSNRVPALDSQAEQAELSRVLLLKDIANYIPVHATKKQIINAVIEHFMQSEGTEIIHLLPYLQTLSSAEVISHIGDIRASVFTERLNTLIPMYATYLTDKAKVEIV